MNFQLSSYLYAYLQELLRWKYLFETFLFAFDDVNLLVHDQHRHRQNFLNVY